MRTKHTDLVLRALVPPSLSNGLSRHLDVSPRCCLQMGSHSRGVGAIAITNRMVLCVHVADFGFACHVGQGAHDRSQALFIVGIVADFGVLPIASTSPSNVMVVHMSPNVDQ